MDELSKFIGTLEEGEEATPIKKKRKKREKPLDPEEVEVEGEKGEGVEGVEAKSKTKSKKVKPAKIKRDNIAYIQQLESISGARKFLQTAIAKKAKSIDRADAVARYEEEITAARARLEELLSLAKSSDDLIEALVAGDEEPNKIITHYLAAKEIEFEEWTQKNQVKVPKSALKNIPDEVPLEFLNDLPLDLHEVLLVRHDRLDYRLRSTCRAYNFLLAVEAGNIIYKEGKWLTTQD